MAFKVFDAYGAASRPTATLRASGYLFLSKSIQKRAGNEAVTHVRLSFDEETDKIGIKLLTHLLDNTDDSSVREVSTEKSGVSVNVLPLLRYYEFEKPTAKNVFPVAFEEGMIIVDLKGLRSNSLVEEYS